MKKNILIASILVTVAAPVVFGYTESYSVRVSQQSGSYSTEDGAVGFAWKNAKLSVDGSTVSGSLDLKVWNDKRTPITQLYIAVERKVYKCVFNRVPRSNSKEEYANVTFSFTVNYPSEGATYDVDLIQTQAMTEEAGKDHVEVEKGGWVAKFGRLSTH